MSDRERARASGVREIRVLPVVRRDVLGYTTARSVRGVRVFEDFAVATDRVVRSLERERRVVVRRARCSRFYGAAKCSRGVRVFVDFVVATEFERERVFDLWSSRVRDLVYFIFLTPCF